MLVVCATEHAACRTERDQMAAVLRVLRDGARNVVKQYETNGPMYTSRGGSEYYDAAFVLNDAKETLQYISQVLPE